MAHHGFLEHQERQNKPVKLGVAIAEVPQTELDTLSLEYGVRIQEMTDDLKEAFGSEDNAGVLISQVLDGSAAKQAGLKAGDVIVSLGTDEIISVHDVYTSLGDYSPGDKLNLAIVRDREKRSMQIELGAASHSSQSFAMHPHGMRGHGKRGHGTYGHGYHGHHGMISKHGCGMHKGQRRS